MYCGFLFICVLMLAKMQSITHSLYLSPLPANIKNRKFWKRRKKTEDGIKIDSATYEDFSFASRLRKTEWISSICFSILLNRASFLLWQPKHVYHPKIYIHILLAERSCRASFSLLALEGSGELISTCFSIFE